jgi:hypothetical protein
MSLPSQSTKGHVLPQGVTSKLQAYNVEKLDPNKSLTAAQHSYFVTAKSSRATIDVLNAAITTQNNVYATLGSQSHQLRTSEHLCLGPDESLLPSPLAPSPAISSSDPSSSKTLGPSNVAGSNNTASNSGITNSSNAASNSLASAYSHSALCQ